MTEHGRFQWNEMVSNDQARSGDFYCSLLGWNRREIDAGRFGTYTVFSQDGVDVAGMMSPAGEPSRSLAPRWVAYIAVADVDASAARAVVLGGRIVEPATDIPNVGRACMIADPLGAVVCLATFQ